MSSIFPSDKFTRFCQWKNVELNIHVSGLGELTCQETVGKCGGQGSAISPTVVALEGRKASARIPVGEAGSQE